MQLGRVCGNVVATLHHAALHGHRLMLVQPVDASGAPHGRVVTALDVVDSGPGDLVLLLDEGTSASQVLGTPRGPVRTLVVAVVDAAIQDATRG